MGKEQSIAFITTRWRSTRLPGKALEMIGDKNVTQHMVDRLRKVKEINEVVVVTSKDSWQIVEYCRIHNIPCIEHHNDYDYFGQLMAGVIAYQPDIIVRTWGDCPFICPGVVQKTLELAKQKNLYIEPICQNGLNVHAYPIEVFRRMVGSMGQYDKWTFNAKDETAWVKSHKLLFQYDTKTEGEKLSVDTPDDLRRLRIYYDKTRNG